MVKNYHLIKSIKSRVGFLRDVGCEEPEGKDREYPIGGAVDGFVNPRNPERGMDRVHRPDYGHVRAVARPQHSQDIPGMEGRGRVAGIGNARDFP